jgi:hypothetical protein
MNARALRIDHTGNHEVVEGDVRSTEFLREQIGCQWFEAIHIDERPGHGLVAWLDEEGRLNGSPSNYAASLLLAALDHGVGIVAGTVLITRRQGENNADLALGDITGIVHKLDGIREMLADMDRRAQEMRDR